MDAVVPAAPEEADPFESEATEDGLVMFAGAFLLKVPQFAWTGESEVSPLQPRLAD